MYFKDVEIAWKNVEDKHDEFLISLEDDIGDEETWILEIQLQFQDIRKRYVRFKSDFHFKFKLKALERARDVEYDAFMKFYKNLEFSIDRKYPIETVSREKIILERQFDVKKKHSEFSNIYERANINSNVSTQILFGENFSILKKSR